MEVSLQFAKLAVNVPNAKFIYIAGGDFCLDLSSTGTRRQRNFQGTLKKICPKATDHREPSCFVNTIIAHTLLLQCTIFSVTTINIPLSFYKKF